MTMCLLEPTSSKPVVHDAWRCDEIGRRDADRTTDSTTLGALKSAPFVRVRYVVA